MMQSAYAFEVVDLIGCPISCIQQKCSAFDSSSIQVQAYFIVS